MLRAVFVVALALVLAACGGGSGPDRPRLSAQEFRTKSDAVCFDVRTRANALQPPSSLDFFPAYADKLLPIIDDGNRRLNELVPPEELEDTVEEWRDARDARRDSLAELREAALESDQERFDEVRKEGDEHDKHADGLARELGLQSCGAAA